MLSRYVNKPSVSIIGCENNCRMLVQSRETYRPNLKTDEVTRVAASESGRACERRAFGRRRSAASDGQKAGVADTRGRGPRATVVEVHLALDGLQRPDIFESGLAGSLGHLAGVLDER
jgi:hypothetical protein